MYHRVVGAIEVIINIILCVGLHQIVYFFDCIRFVKRQTWKIRFILYYLYINVACAFLRGCVENQIIFCDDVSCLTKVTYSSRAANTRYSIQ